MVYLHWFDLHKRFSAGAFCAAMHSTIQGFCEHLVAMGFLQAGFPQQICFHIATILFVIVLCILYLYCGVFCVVCFVYRSL